MLEEIEFRYSLMKDLVDENTSSEWSNILHFCKRGMRLILKIAVVSYPMLRRLSLGIVSLFFS